MDAHLDRFQIWLSDSRNAAHPSFVFAIFNGFANFLDLDSDNDGLTDADERVRHTNPCAADTDGDGISDGLEVAARIRDLKEASDEVLADERILELTRWVASRYACSWGEALNAAIP